MQRQPSDRRAFLKQAASTGLLVSSGVVAQAFLQGGSVHAKQLIDARPLIAHASSWSSWEDLGGIITSGPAAASWSSGRLDCFAKGTDNAMWHKWFDGGWSGWESLGGVIDNAPAAVSWGRNRIDCFARGMNNHMWHKWWG